MYQGSIKNVATAKAQHLILKICSERYIPVET